MSRVTSSNLETPNLGTLGWHCQALSGPQGLVLCLFSDTQSSVWGWNAPAHKESSVCLPGDEGQSTGKENCQAQAGSDHKPAFHIGRKFFILPHLLPQTGLEGRQPLKKTHFTWGRRSQARVCIWFAKERCSKRYIFKRNLIFKAVSQWWMQLQGCWGTWCPQSSPAALCFP